MATDAVKKYLEDTNRPYSCADVTVNLRGAFTKSAIQKALDALSEAGKIKCKLYGKQKVYAAIQHDNADGPSENEDYDTPIKTTTIELEELNTQLKTKEASLKSLLAAPTSDSARVQAGEIKTNIEKLESRLATLRDSVEETQKDMFGNDRGNARRLSEVQEELFRRTLHRDRRNG
ncbi:unnamed protein product [Leptidea sinapis]|uniref:Homologous-pairing protein 2 winged helix domain-containing protein n=1 Tax=Leptidea sinapis TaxID=189913 RepID=A0A5E4QAN3_9NEOP|nr:unnamed protein product [Leptidea sinapis]